MVQEASPASLGKAGIESQQGLGWEGRLEVFGPVNLLGAGLTPKWDTGASPYPVKF